jgi:lipopolysaccharide heptosyltransferase II
MKKIVVFEYYYLGDLVMATPALRALRGRFPDAEIDLVAPSSAHGMNRHFPWIDKIIPFRSPWTSDRLPFASMVLSTFRLLNRLRGSRYDMAIELRGDLRNILLAYLSGAKRRVSFGITGGEYLLTDVVPYDDEFLKHQLEGNLEVVRFLGCDTSENFPELAVVPDAERSVAAFLEKHPKPVIGIHPGASKKNKLWEVGKWAQLVDRMIVDLDATVMILHDPSNEESELAGTIRHLVASDNRCVPYCGTISHLISMIHHLDLLVALDSFSSHIAASVGTPFVTLFGPQNPQLTRPYHYNGRIAFIEDVACRPCGTRCIHGDDNRCMKEISLDKVWHLVTKVWQRQGPKYPFFGLAIGGNSPVKEIKP